jgi:threonylcarbamoyladenosine tRNA methylthiotransferase MtaB
MIKECSDAGFEIVDFDELSDFYIVNSCSVTNLSTRKTRQYLSKAKKNGGIVILVGCYAQEIKDKDDIKNVDIILGNEEKKEIVKYLTEYKVNNRLIDISDIGQVKKYIQKYRLDKAINVRESVKIEDGCNNFCSYCIIPYVRGRVRSRDLNEIIDEVKELVSSGVGEIVLVGIEIASYGKDLGQKISLIDVIEAVSKVDGLKRIRLGSIEPRILTDDTIDRMSKIGKLCPHFHISVQSLDNEVLKRMNRKYTREYVISTVERIRKVIPNASFTCDVIVGFPGETDEEFSNTLAGVNEIKFYEIHVFKYSKRKWTKAEKMENQVDGNVSNDRSEKLIKRAAELKNEYMSKYIGKELPVLFESYLDGYLYGYTPNYIKVKVRGDEKLWGCQLKTELVSIEKDLILGNLSQ